MGLYSESNVPSKIKVSRKIFQRRFFSKVFLWNLFELVLRVWTGLVPGLTTRYTIPVQPYLVSSLGDSRESVLYSEKAIIDVQWTTTPRSSMLTWLNILASRGLLLGFVWVPKRNRFQCFQLCTTWRTNRSWKNHRSVRSSKLVENAQVYFQKWKSLIFHR